jgi:uncharacterized protein YkwD
MKLNLILEGVLKMFRMSNLSRKFAVCLLAFVVLFAGVFNGAGVSEVFALAENTATVRIGNNAPMNFDAFTEWRNQRGIRHFNIDGRIYPACVFFNSVRGQSFGYGELSNGILRVYLRPNVIVEGGSVSPPLEVRANENISQEIESEENHDLSPVVFNGFTPVLFSDDELTAMLERVPHQNALDTRSTVNLSNRRLTENELAAWIDEYTEMGGATAFELAVVREINRVRTQQGLQPLALDPALMLSARLKAQEFGDLQYFAHASPAHGSVTAAARMIGFEGNHATETITRTGSNGAPELRTTPERIVEGMLSSTRGHREILLNPNLYSVGFGSFFSPNSTGSDGNMTHMFYHVTQFGFFG